MTRSLTRATTLALLLAAGAARAQMMPGSADMRTGVRAAWRATGEHVWNVVDQAWASVATAGLVDGGKTLSGLSVEHGIAALEFGVYVPGKGWTAWMPGSRRFDAGEASLRGFRARTDRGQIRYRLSFVDGSESGWKSGGEDAGGEGSAAIESVTIEYLPVARAGYNFEYRVLFRKAGWTAWLKGGAKAEGNAKDPEEVVLGYEIRGGEGIRYEATTAKRKAGRTMVPSQTAGSTDPADPLETIQLFGGKEPLRYRVRTVESGWTGWCADGLSCGDAGRGMRTIALQIGPSVADR